MVVVTTTEGCEGADQPFGAENLWNRLSTGSDAPAKAELLRAASLRMAPPASREPRDFLCSAFFPAEGPGNVNVVFRMGMLVCKACKPPVLDGWRLLDLPSH